jgi:transcriptional antiterminator
MKIINKNNTIFSSDEFIKDKYLFAVFQKKINHENAKIMSDEENYVITNESEDRAPWIWTKDNFDSSKLKEIEELIKEYLVKDKMTFTCKKELYDKLIEDNFELIDKSDYFELGFMKCENLKDTKPND